MKPTTMRTETTLCSDLSDLLQETRLHENNGWGVRQIVVHPPNVHGGEPIIIVVFEKEQ